VGEDESSVTCICCPMGCKIRVYRQDGEWKTADALCKRGVEYAVQEVVDPRRVLTSSVRINGGVVRMLPVRSNGEIPRDLVAQAVRILGAVVIDAPVNVGDVVYEDICGSGVDVVATRSMKRVE